MTKEATDRFFNNSLLGIIIIKMVPLHETSRFSIFEKNIEVHSDTTLCLSSSLPFSHSEVFMERLNFDLEVFEQ